MGPCCASTSPYVKRGDALLCPAGVNGGGGDFEKPPCTEGVREALGPSEECWPTISSLLPAQGAHVWASDRHIPGLARATEPPPVLLGSQPAAGPHGFSARSPSLLPCLVSSLPGWVLARCASLQEEEGEGLRVCVHLWLRFLPDSRRPPAVIVRVPPSVLGE